MHTLTVIIQEKKQHTHHVEESPYACRRRRKSHSHDRKMHMLRLKNANTNANVCVCMCLMHMCAWQHILRCTATVVAAAITHE